MSAIQNGMKLGPWARRFRFPKPATPLNPEAISNDISPDTQVLARRYEPVELKSTIEGFLPRCHGAYNITDTYRIYDRVSPDDSPLPNIDLLLVDNVEEWGVAGDVVPVTMNKVTPLLISGRAVYNSPANRDKYSALIESLPDRKSNLSVQVMKTAKFLSAQVLAVTMNMDTSWTIEAWHVRTCFRKAGINVPESSIQMPERPISGPDMAGLQDKVFLVDVTINGVETVPVRCRIHHVPTNMADRIPYKPFHWAGPMTPVFPEDEERIASLPPVSGPKDSTEIRVSWAS